MMEGVFVLLRFSVADSLAVTASRGSGVVPLRSRTGWFEKLASVDKQMLASFVGSC